MDEVTSELWMLEAKALFVGLKSLCFFVQNCKKLPKKVQRFNAQVFRLVNHHWKMAIWIFWQNSARKNLRETGGLFLGDIDFLLRPAGAAKAKSALWVSRSGRWRKWGQQVPKAEEVMPGDFDVAVDGWNPAVAPVDMVNIPLYLQGFLHTSWLFGISEPIKHYDNPFWVGRTTPRDTSWGVVFLGSNSACQPTTKVLAKITIFPRWLGQKSRPGMVWCMNFGGWCSGKQDVFT